MSDFDAALTALVRPDGWVNPQPRDLYDLVVVGGGAAGLVSAVGAAGVGARVALLERGALGGECLMTGCVPSKALLRSARAAREARDASRYGVATGPSRVDVPAVMARMRRLRADLARHDAASRLAGLGIDVCFGHAAFDGPGSLVADGRRFRFRRAIIATGSRPAMPPVPGLRESGAMTHQQIFDLPDRPRRLLVVGGGPAGCELAQAFALFGSEVTIVERAGRLLPREDPDGSAIVERSLRADGVRNALGATLTAVRSTGMGVLAEWTADDTQGSVEADLILVATGRAPNVEGLGLEAAGIRSGPDGIEVTPLLRTTNRRVFAAGDVATRWKFTHTADATARLAVQNALFFGRRGVDDLVVPWCTFTVPEVAHVGPAYDELAGGSTVTIPWADVDRAVLDSDTEGFLRVHHDRGRIRACTIVGPHAGELIAVAAEAMRRGASLEGFAGGVFPYPTYGEAFRKAGDAHRRTRLTPFARRALGAVLAFTRRW